MMEERETYYELYKDGSCVSSYILYEDALEQALHCLDDDCAEIYKVVVYEERVL